MQATTGDNWIDAALQHGKSQMSEQSADSPLVHLAEERWT